MFFYSRYFFLYLFSYNDNDYVYVKNVNFQSVMHFKWKYPVWIHNFLKTFGNNKKKTENRNMRRSFTYPIEKLSDCMYGCKYSLGSTLIVINKVPYDNVAAH